MPRDFAVMRQTVYGKSLQIHKVSLIHETITELPSRVVGYRVRIQGNPKWKFHMALVGVPRIQQEAREARILVEMKRGKI